MDFTALKAAVTGAGWSRFSSTIVGQLVNDATAELDEMANWPYLESSATGTAPLTIATLRNVDIVLDTTLKLSIPNMAYSELVEQYGDLTTTGTAAYWYSAWSSGSPTIATYPVTTNTIGVQFWQITPTLSAGADTPLSPSRWHRIIVNIALREAYRRITDHDTAEKLHVQIERDKAEMLGSLLIDDLPKYQSIYFASEDW